MLLLSRTSTKTGKAEPKSFEMLMLSKMGATD